MLRHSAITCIGNRNPGLAVFAMLACWQVAERKEYGKVYSRLGTMSTAVQLHSRQALLQLLPQALHNSVNPRCFFRCFFLEENPVTLHEL